MACIMRTQLFADPAGAGVGETSSIIKTLLGDIHYARFF